jgi:hypothetical protein
MTCLSTIAVPAGLFKDLYDGPIFSERQTNTENCPGYCGDRDNFEPCEAECECAYVREIIQIVRKWPKDKCTLAKIARDVTEIENNQPLTTSCRYPNS